MSDETLTPEEEDRVLAAEYVLGLLNAGQRRAFEDRSNHDPALRALVAAWAEDFVALTDDMEEVEAPSRVWDGIRAEVFNDRVEGGFFQRLGLVPLVLGTALACLFAFFAFQLGWMDPNAGPEMQARIVAEDESVLYSAAYDVDSETLTLVREGAAAASGRAHELWLIAPGGAAPVSLLVWPEDETETRIVVPEDLRAGLPGATLAISDEPPGGSPTGAPTGDVLAAGTITGA